MSQILGVDVYRWLELTLAIIGTILAAYIISWITAKILEKTGYTKELTRRFSRLVRYVIYIMGGVLTLFYFAFDIGGAIVALGAVGIAVGIGLGTVLSGVFSGLVVVFDKTFAKGDEVKVGGFEGKVVNISIRRVTLETKDGEIVFVPTSYFLTFPYARKGKSVTAKDQEPDRI
ncbi:MAG TPA: mechanosensitive ion channel domain-containing protein [Candidatus Bathyarchaeia archaeon]|nr:mechanosensitive ion channel domain-containing protein [Candidatus Bathyarchaeia archaeon]